MIAVIADDFTGAAEIGGIGLRHGLHVEINTRVNLDTKADLLVIDADSRSVKEGAAVKRVTEITEALMPLRPEWIYKKTDSVLRGHIIPELQAQLKILGMQRALLVPANPNLGRTIRDGHYYFNDAPIHQTGFSVDPEFAITSSSVQDMLKAKLPVAKPGDSLPATGIVVGEAREMKDLDGWAHLCGGDILAAGAAGFFSALLDCQQVSGSRKKEVKEMGSPALFVCGTSFARSTKAIKQIAENGGPVCYLPAANQPIISLLETHGKAIIAIDPDIKDQNAAELRLRTAEIVKEIVENFDLRELVIEGGSTARAIFDRLPITGFFPVQELSPGVVRMKVTDHENIFITVKPGSYAWPAGAWNF